MYKLTDDDIKLISSKLGLTEAEARKRAYVTEDGSVIFDFGHPDLKYVNSPCRHIGKVIEGKLVLL